MLAYSLSLPLRLWVIISFQQAWIMADIWCSSSISWIIYSSTHSLERVRSHYRLTFLHCTRVSLSWLIKFQSTATPFSLCSTSGHTLQGFGTTESPPKKEMSTLSICHRFPTGERSSRVHIALHKPPRCACSWRGISKV